MDPARNVRHITLHHVETVVGFSHVGLHGQDPFPHISVVFATKRDGKRHVPTPNLGFEPLSKPGPRTVRQNSSAEAHDLAANWIDVFNLNLKGTILRLPGLYEGDRQSVY